MRATGTPLERSVNTWNSTRITCQGSSLKLEKRQKAGSDPTGVPRILKRIGQSFEDRGFDGPVRGPGSRGRELNDDNVSNRLPGSHLMARNVSKLL